MNILVTNDDGVLSEGLWTLVRELKNVARVIVAAPDREQSAIGTAVTLRHPLSVQELSPLVADVITYSVSGTPSDSVILAMGKLIKEKIDLVISGINDGLNLGEDVHISGTVGGALQGYLRGCPTMAISAPYGNNPQFKTAAKVGAILAQKIAAVPRSNRIFLNVNMPDSNPEEIKGVEITRLARESHINSVEEGNHGWHNYFWLLRQRSAKTVEKGTDIYSVEQGNISITPMYTTRSDKPPGHILDELCSSLIDQMPFLKQA